MNAEKSGKQRGEDERKTESSRNGEATVRERGDQPRKSLLYEGNESGTKTESGINEGEAKRLRKMPFPPNRNHRRTLRSSSAFSARVCAFLFEIVSLLIHLTTAIFISLAETAFAEGPIRRYSIEAPKIKTYIDFCCCRPLATQPRSLLYATLSY